MQVFAPSGKEVDMARRVFVIVLDSFGVGNAPDAFKFDDEGANTLKTIYESSEYHTPNMEALGLLNIDGIDYATPVELPIGAYGRMQEVSQGKDTTIGHWEIAGIISAKPLPTYPNGFPKEIIDKLKAATGRGILCNKPYSGTAVINDYGDEHVRTGDLIVYTSADSVFQVAAHEEVVPLEELYQCCHQARELLQGEHGVGRVIARPFIGTSGNYTRTAHRHDYSLPPQGVTMLDLLKDAGRDVIAVGKINDIFAGRGITEYTYTESNADGIDKTLAMMEKDFHGLCFTNLVDYDMLYGHRRDIDGYAKALSYFDEKLPEFLSGMGEDDVLMVTADHGCDPSYKLSTDHTREYTPFVMYGKKIKPVNYGTRDTFADIAATVLDLLGVDGKVHGTSLLDE